MMTDTSTSLAASWQPGAYVGRYRLQTRLGGGSSGDVWRAVDDEGDGRAVAIKALKETLLRSKQREKHQQRFQTEIRALQTFTQQPHVPTLYSAHPDDERPYFVMEYVPGESFAARIASGAMMQTPLLERLEQLKPIAQTIDAIHAGGFVHRDIKPANLHGWERPYLLDFSVCAEQEAVRNNGTQPIGTRLYMPPESPNYPPPFQDHFGFALVCYEVLFGLHALFAPHELSREPEELYALAARRIAERDWYLPSRLHDAQVPGALQGVDLVALDSLFHQAFTDTTQEAVQPLVNALVYLVTQPSNVPYLEHVPQHAPPTRQQITLDTETGVTPAQQAPSSMIIVLGLGAVVLVIVGLWLLVLFMAS